MPWKERYTISDEKSIVDSDIKWPDGKRCCFRVVVDLSPACGPDGIKPADLATPDAYYGMNGGLAALMAVLDRYDIKATFAVPAVIAEIQADTLRRLAGEGHEIAGHGSTVDQVADDGEHRGDEFIERRSFTCDRAGYGGDWRQSHPVLARVAQDVDQIFVPGVPRRDHPGHPPPGATFGAAG
jgi:peptidoglycan/xylan/chitin deacetylase (PgdA/CDA1 family)